MTFDPRSLEHLQKLGRQLPQELPKPSIANQKSREDGRKKLHPIKIENDPNTLFQELIKASPDGNVPSHLIDRQKRLEKKQLDKSSNHPIIKDDASSRKQPNKKSQEESLYASFHRILLEDED